MKETKKISKLGCERKKKKPLRRRFGGFVGRVSRVGGRGLWGGGREIKGFVGGEAEAEVRRSGGSWVVRRRRGSAVVGAEAEAGIEVRAW